MIYNRYKRRAYSTDTDSCVSARNCYTLQNPVRSTSKTCQKGELRARNRRRRSR
ncbi:PxORF58 peptide [Plutella xylostella granulovirus]|uniref:ORF56 protein n=1 Tax=Plutella xylostella granulovirus TaxID=98383 RepID=Q9DVX5_9BBAC|nr:PxORF58 peptide [Plutella xylostella granulovirus]AAG27356.1 PxORF58 peptide [Plutella xylostella granulovirus]ANY57577.1 PlxyGVORF58 protein [Plutella xylostella granulovirus]QKV49981.1 ORF56 protein [Plutella xylostella granulovirus]QKV50099.1 ORF56 protein [Plutella xylostella granulovirus]QKV50217.1 ORF56 protein [Plutella xylostella granulovirus]